ncbi:transposon Ty3-I Gag-Pol polyprotein [Trichonephila clavipes]|nr:transposon Ty3-I Gag-Pol polyprotein [Trichonephila clavipes]
MRLVGLLFAQSYEKEVHRLVNQTQESLDSTSPLLEEIVQDEVERVLAQCQQKLQKLNSRPTYAAVTRKYRAPVKKFPPEPRKTDVWRTADNRPDFIFHCGRPWTCNALLPREKAVLTLPRNRRRNSTMLALKKKYADQTLLAVLRCSTRGRSQYVVIDPRRHIADPVSRQAVGARVLRRATFQRSEAACTVNPPSTAKMTGNQLDVIIDKKPIRALVDLLWGIVFCHIDKYRRFLKKVLFADAKSVMLKVADGNFVRPIEMCFTCPYNNRELPFLNLLFLSHCSHDVILGWDFLEASQAVIDCGQNELVLEDICRDSQRLTPGICMPPGTIHLSRIL